MAKKKTRRAAGGRGRGGRPAKSEMLSKRSAVFERVLDEYRKSPERGVITIKDIESIAETTPPTARNILDDVADIIRFVRPTRNAKGIEWGGDQLYERSLGHNRELKEAIARGFVELLPSTTSIACTAGTTVTYCVGELNRVGKRAHVVTNNLGIVQHWSGVEEGLDLTGGVYDPATNALSGLVVQQSFQTMKCSIGLIGVSGVTPSGALFVRHRWEAQYRAAILHAVTDAIYICADAEKLTVRDLWQFATIREIVALRPNRKTILITNDPGLLRKDRKQAEDALNELQDSSEELGKDRFEVVVVKGLK